VNQAAVWAALTAWTWYAFGPLPLQLALNGEAHLDGDLASSAVASSWLGAAAVTLGLSLLHRQPISFSVPGVALVFMHALARTLRFEELLGAIMVAGLVVTVVAASGLSTRLVSWMPPAIVMAMFAGIVVDVVRRAVSATLADLVVGGATVAGFALGRLLGHPRVPPMGLATVAGGIAVAMTYDVGSRPIGWEPPQIVLASPTVSVAGILAVTVPLVIVLLGANLAPVCAFLRGEGYAPPTRQMALAIGLSALVTPIFGGLMTAPSRDGGAIMAGPDAGPHAGRYTATMIGGGLMLALGFAASTVVALAVALPASFIVVLMGLSILGPLQSALGRAFDGPLRFGPTIAFVVALTPFTALGLPSSCWA
jgi:benzoate membrane transport protein